MPAGPSGAQGATDIGPISGPTSTACLSRNDVQVVARKQIAGRAAGLLASALLVIGPLGKAVVVAARVVFPGALPGGASAERPGHVHIHLERRAARLVGVALRVGRERSAEGEDEHGQAKKGHRTILGGRLRTGAATGGLRCPGPTAKLAKGSGAARGGTRSRLDPDASAVDALAHAIPR